MNSMSGRKNLLRQIVGTLLFSVRFSVLRVLVLAGEFIPRQTGHSRQRGRLRPEPVKMEQVFVGP